MEIFLNEIPEEGLHRAGEFPVSLFDLAPDDPIRPVSAVDYDVEMHRFEDVVTFHGSLKGKFQLQCSVCLEYVDFEADFQNWSSDLDLEEGQRSFDLAQVIREDFLLELPASPRCDELVAGRICPKAEEIERVHEQAEENEEEGDRPDPWSALDSLD